MQNKKRSCRRMKKVIEKTTVLNDHQKSLLQQIDFCDSFATTNHTDSIERITNLIFNTTPAWVKSLFTIRNKIVKIMQKLYNLAF